MFDGRRAIGVEYRQDGATHVAHADGEVILAAARSTRRRCCSFPGSARPQLLRSHGIGVIADMPGVGADLQDHFQVRMQYRCTEPITMNDVIN